MSSEALFEILDRLARELPFGVIAVDRCGHIRAINPVAAGFLGTAPQEAAGQLLVALLPETRLNEVLVRRKPCTYYLSNKDKRVRATAVPVLGPDELLVGGLESYEDRTELEELSGELRHLACQNRLLDTILNTAFEDIGAVDREGRITYLSAKTATKLGVDRKAVVGRLMREIRHDCLMEEVARTGVPRMGELWRVNKASVPVMVLPIVRNGRVEGAVCKSVFRDMEEARLFVERFKLCLNSKAKHCHAGVTARYCFEDIVGASPGLLRAKELARRVAAGDATVLLVGESGSGKELFAHAIHDASPRREGPFIRVNCAGVPETLLESELFGYEEGAFTGARRGGKQGKFELAHGGTIFLDEVGDMSPAMQAKLLRVLQEGEIQKVGGTAPQRVDVRVVAATNADLRAKVARGEFREDLYYRLEVIKIEIPPLRERAGDVDLLIDHLLPLIAARQGKNCARLDPDLRRCLNLYDWPGNVRELVNVLEGAVCLATGPAIGWEDLPPHFADRLRTQLKLTLGVEPRGMAAGRPEMSLPEAACPLDRLSDTVEEAEKSAVQKALEATGGNKRRAAKLLGVARSTFYEKLKKYHLA